MEAKKFKVIIVEDVKAGIKRNGRDIPSRNTDAEVIGTAMTEQESGV